VLLVLVFSEVLDGIGKLTPQRIRNYATPCFFAKKLIHHTGNFFRKLKIAYLRSADVTIGKNCMISFGAKIDVRKGSILIGNNCTITHGCVILSHDRAASQIDPGDSGYGTVVIEDNSFVGVNSVILRNVIIGEGSIIGANSVVTKNIPPRMVAVGNPARVIRRLE